MVDLEPKSKFTFIAEVLPQNDRTREIMAAREAKENQKRAEEEEVSYFNHFNIPIPNYL